MHESYEIVKDQVRLGKGRSGIICGIPIGNVFCDLIGSIAKVDGRSMQPTLNPNPLRQDFILLNKWNKYDVSRGDIIVMISPKNPEIRLVKRVIALEGDIVTKFGLKASVVAIPEGHIWVEGDHTDQSMDSNSFGPVPLGLVEAKVVCIVWPLNRIQTFSTAKAKI